MARRWPVVLLAAVGMASLVAAWRQPDPPRIFEDDRDFLAAAAHLCRSGVVSFQPLDSMESSPGAFREPGYPALLALGWRVAGAPAPDSQDELSAILDLDAAWRPIRAVNLALLVAAALLCGWSARRLAGETAGALAFAAVASSPALQATGRVAMSENAGAAIVAWVAATWTACAARPSRFSLAVAVAATSMAPLVRAESVVLLPVAIGWLALGGRRKVGAPTAAVAAILLLLPSVGWALRNRFAVGHAVLSDRGGLALSVRAELDREIARHGALPAMLAWTPLEAARRAGRRLAPEATFLDQRPVGPGNFFTATLKRWKHERELPGADPLAVDACYRSAALAAFWTRPASHLVSIPVVAWRGLFVERSPAWASPFDLSLPLGLLLASAVVAFAVVAMRRRDAARLAWLAPLLVLVLFHALTTEFLPRYASPLLPAAWTALAVVAADLWRARFADSG